MGFQKIWNLHFFQISHWVWTLQATSQNSTIKTIKLLYLSTNHWKSRNILDHSIIPYFYTRKFSMIQTKYSFFSRLFLLFTTPLITPVEYTKQLCVSILIFWKFLYAVSLYSFAIALRLNLYLYLCVSTIPLIYGYTN